MLKKELRNTGQTVSQHILTRFVFVTFFKRCLGRFRMRLSVQSTIWAGYKVAKIRFIEFNRWGKQYFRLIRCIECNKDSNQINLTFKNKRQAPVIRNETTKWTYSFFEGTGGNDFEAPWIERLAIRWIISHFSFRPTTFRDVSVLNSIKAKRYWIWLLYRSVIMRLFSRWLRSLRRWMTALDNVSVHRKSPPKCSARPATSDISGKWRTVFYF